MTVAALGHWFIGACVLAALLLAGIGAGAAFAALKRTKTHAEALVPSDLIARAALAQANAERLSRTLTRMQLEVPRVNAALATISAAFRELKLAFAYRR